MSDEGSTVTKEKVEKYLELTCLLYTSDAADD